MGLSRRQFAGAGLASIAFAGVGYVALRPRGPDYRDEVAAYGPLISDPEGLLDLPAGFHYSIISAAGETMDDGFFAPDHFDGMGCFPLGGPRIALVRNHELLPEHWSRGASGNLDRLGERLARDSHYGKDTAGRVLPGGTSTIVYNQQSGRREQQFLSLAGTVRNCSGGETPWGSWLSCEETVLAPDEVERPHGWVFEVPVRNRGLARPTPIKAMGRFNHEAAAVDPATGIVYLTEDREDGLFYRYIPASQDDLASGGRLQALGLIDSPAGADTRNWLYRGMKVGSARATCWIDLAEVESPADDLRRRGHNAGAALFARAEGIYRGTGEYYFTCTSGGTANHGQIMRYRPSSREGAQDETSAPGTLELFVESTDETVLDYGDGLTLTPWGHLMICEDRPDGQINHLKGITPAGTSYTLARVHDAEPAGVCFSPDGATMFVNFYYPGKTLAIRGPWAHFATS